MKRKFSQWDKDAEYGSDILGTGSYSVLPPSGKPRKSVQIGFIRQQKKAVTPQNIRRNKA